MANPRPTFQQRLFSDEELPLPLHDQIVRWSDLALKNRLHPILTALSIPHSVADDGACCGWLKAQVWDNFSEYDKNLRRAADDLTRKIKPEKPSAPPITTTSVVWEPILKDDRGTIVGAVDLFALIRIATPILHISSERVYGRPSELSWATGLLNQPQDFVVATRDYAWLNAAASPVGDLRPDLPNDAIALVCTTESIYSVSSCYWKADQQYGSDIPLYLEAKTKIRSAGELLRQINLYKGVSRTGAKFIVVAPSNAWEEETRDILREQGVATLNYMAN